MHERNMANQTVKTRYLMTCATDAAMKKAAKLLESEPRATSLISSNANRRGVSRDAGVINEEIRVISVALTPSQHQKVKKSKVCRIEEDLHAFACVRPTDVRAAVEDFPYPWGIKKIDADIVWPKTKGKGVRVAVLDTGSIAAIETCKPTSRGASRASKMLLPLTTTTDTAHTALGSSLRTFQVEEEGPTTRFMAWLLRQVSFRLRCSTITATDY